MLSLLVLVLVAVAPSDPKNVHAMTLLELRAEVLRLRSQGTEEVQVLRRQLAALEADHDSLLKQMAELQHRLQVYNLSTRPADPAKRPSGITLTESENGLEVSELRLERVNDSYHVRGIVRNRGDRDLADVRFFVEVIQSETDQTLQTSVNALRQPLNQGEMRRFDFYVDRFQGARLEMTVYGAPDESANNNR